jgi:tetratricopeptide (TPR) repeat protein
VWPDFAGAYYQAGRIRGRELGEYDQALTDLSNAIRLAPEWAEPYLQRGMLQRFHGEIEAALSDLRQFVAIAPEGYWKNEALHQIEALVADEKQGDKETGR